MKRKFTDKEDFFSFVKPIRPWSWKTCNCCGSEFKFEKGWRILYSIFWMDSPMRPFDCLYYLCRDCAPNREAVYKWYLEFGRKRAPTEKDWEGV